MHAMQQHLRLALVKPSCVLRQWVLAGRSTPAPLGLRFESSKSAASGPSELASPHDDYSIDTAPSTNRVSVEKTANFDPAAASDIPAWRRRKEEAQQSYDGPWRPVKRVARSTMDKMRFLHREFPEEYTIQRLSDQFGISFEAIRRVLHSKYQPSHDVVNRQEQRRADDRRAYVDSIFEERRQNERASAVSSNEQVERPLAVPDATEETDHQYEKPRRKKAMPSRFDSTQGRKKWDAICKMDSRLQSKFTNYTLFEALQRGPMYPAEVRWKTKIRVRRARKQAEEVGVTEQHLDTAMKLWKSATR